MVFNIQQEPTLNVFKSARVLSHIMLYFKSNSELMTESHKNCSNHNTLNFCKEVDICLFLILFVCLSLCMIGSERLSFFLLCKSIC